jgi:hypothetical protein
MNLESVIAVSRSELSLLARSIVRLLQWGAIIAIGAAVVQVARSPQISVAQICMLLATICLSSLGILILVAAKTRTADQKTWIGIHAGLVTVAAVAFIWSPQWSGFISMAFFVPLVLAPGTLRLIASRRAAGGDLKAAAFYASLMFLLHPSKQIRFWSSYLNARALASTEEKIAAYRSLAIRATTEQFALLNCEIAIAVDDWEGVLGQIRSGSTAMPFLKPLEIRALGELRRMEDMVMTYVRAETSLSRLDLLFCRLFVLSFIGDVDDVRSLLARQLRFLSPKQKAYWLFVAVEAAGIDDDVVRRTLISCADATDDETFRRAAQRHLAAPPPAKRACLPE